MSRQENVLGRILPERVGLYGTVKPFSGVGERIRHEGVLPDHDTIIDQMYQMGKQTRRMSTLASAIGESGLKDGMRISFHHHLRLGDRVLSQVLTLLTSLGYRDLILCLSSVMGQGCTAVLEAAKAGVISMIETTGVKSPLSEAIEQGTLGIPVIFRSHGGRAQAIESGRISIDLAFIAASAADEDGNLTGSIGENRFGSLGYAMPDAHTACCVIGITDCIVPSLPVSIPGTAVDMLVVVDSIGSKAGLAGGSIRRTGRPLERLIARTALQAIVASGVIAPGCSFQAGSGGISLEVSTLIAQYLRDHRIPCSFISGGVTAPLVDMLSERACDRLYDVQSFDDQAAVSIAEHPSHIEMSSSLYANPDAPLCIAHQLDLMILSAAEVDLDFHINSLTGTDGRLLGALGGAPDTAAGALLTVVVLPSFRGRIPSVNRRVNTVCTPGSTVDMVVTERGIAVNPTREDLHHRLEQQGIALIPIATLMDRVHHITGIPQVIAPDYEQLRGIIEYRDGTVLDAIWGQRQRLDQLLL
ncbi:MAG: citrate lyase subunit alpha [Spirochaetia bacterium]|nr:citrate lyase subunit alpha [Spirochaetia bacterium]